jgi:hypothetical protein
MILTRAVTLLLISALAVFITGCIACELRVMNHTGGSIQFYTGHAKKAVQIVAGATRTIPHAAVVLPAAEDHPLPFVASARTAV